MLHFVHMRQQFLISKSHSRLAQARTVLVTGVPNELANERDLRTFASFVPGGVDRIWLYRDTGPLNDLFEHRVDACSKLEAAAAEVLKKATLVWRAKNKQYKKSQLRKLKDAECSKEDSGLSIPEANQGLLDELVPLDMRPKHRIGFLGIFGHKVDTIQWCKVWSPRYRILRGF